MAEAKKCSGVTVDGKPCGCVAMKFDPLGRCSYHEAIEPISIVRAMEDPAIFGKAFPGDTWGSWKTILKVLEGTELTEEERALFEKFTGRKISRPQGWEELLAVIGRRGGKSRAAALIAAHAALFGGWDRKAAAGERPQIWVVANDRTQATLVLSYTRALVAMFPDQLEYEGREEIRLKSGVEICVKTCSLRSTRGASICCVVADEVAFWRSEDSSANPAIEVISAILPGLMPGARLIQISTPYSKFGLVYDTWKDHYGKEDSDILVVQAPTISMNPTYSESTIRRLIARDKSRFESEYNSTFRDDISNFLPESLVRPTMVRQVQIPDTNIRYTAFLDPAGGSGQDSFTLAIAHKEGEKFCLDRLEECKPPFSPEAVIANFCEVIRSFSIHSATADAYGGDLVAEPFRKAGIRIDKSPLSASEIYEAALYLFSSGRVELLDHERLASQLLTLERRTGLAGKDRISHPEGSHDDAANAACGALVFAQRERVWSEAEMNARLPQKQHMSPEGQARDERQKLETELRDWMSRPGEGMSRIVR